MQAAGWLAIGDPFPDRKVLPGTLGKTTVLCHNGGNTTGIGQGVEFTQKLRRSHGETGRISQFPHLKYSTLKTLLLMQTDYYSVSQKIPLRFSDIFPKQLGIFSPNFTCLLYVPISMLEYKFFFNYLQL